MKRKVYGIIVAVIVLIGIFSTFSVSAAVAGNCGESTTFTFYENVLTISGSGMVDDNSEWEDYVEQITKVVISEGITDIDDYVFSGHEQLVEVVLPETLKIIGRNSFSDCSGLEKIIIPVSVEEMHKYSFRNCENLTIYCAEGSYAEEFAVENNIKYALLAHAKITFDANGGYYAPAPVSGSIAESFVIPHERAKRENYMFAGWSKDKYATTVNYSPLDAVEISEDMTLYAIWTQCEILTSSTEKRVNVTSLTDVPNLTLYEAAYNDGWCVAVATQKVDLKSGQNSIVVETDWGSVDKDEIRVYLWDVDFVPCTNAQMVTLTREHNVTFVDWDGTVIDTQIVITGEKAILPTAPTRAGYEFCGWDGNLESVISDVTFTAQYVEETKKNVFKVFSTTGKVGDEIVATIYLGGDVETCGFDLRLNYDNNELEYIGVDSNFDLDVVANHVKEESLVKFNFGASKNRERSAKILEVKFKIKGEVGETALTLTPVEIVKADETTEDNKPVPVEYNLENGTVVIQ